VSLTVTCSPHALSSVRKKDLFAHAAVQARRFLGLGSDQLESKRDSLLRS